MKETGQICLSFGWLPWRNHPSGFLQCLWHHQAASTKRVKLTSNDHFRQYVTKFPLTLFHTWVLFLIWCFLNYKTAEMKRLFYNCAKIVENYSSSVCKSIKNVPELILRLCLLGAFHLVQEWLQVQCFYNSYPLKVVFFFNMELLNVSFVTQLMLKKMTALKELHDWVFVCTEIMLHISEMAKVTKHFRKHLVMTQFYVLGILNGFHGSKMDKLYFLMVNVLAIQQH